MAENPIINKVLFDGNDKVDDEMLKGELQLAPRSTYSRAKVQEDVQRILEIYKRTGRYAVVVEPQIIERDQNRVDLILKLTKVLWPLLIKSISSATNIIPTMTCNRKL